jgi:hypothetical protein
VLFMVVPALQKMRQARAVRVAAGTTPSTPLGAGRSTRD